MMKAKRNMSYIINHNSNHGNPEPLLKTEIETDISTGSNIEVKIPIASGTASNTTNQDGRNTSHASVTFQRATPIEVGATVSANSNGDRTGGPTVSASLNNTTLRVEATGTVNTTTGNGNFEMKVQIEQKIDNTKINTGYFMQFGK